jgi:hypothetical protein
VHFLVDYFPNWITQLQHPPSDGQHKQLALEHFHQALQRLETVSEVGSNVQLFSAVYIGQGDWRGEQ